MPERRLMYWRECGGCEGKGAHRRWCPVKVGERAAYFGQLSEQAENLGDRIGPNDMGAANRAWALAGELRTRALEARAAPRESGGRPAWVTGMEEKANRHGDCPRRVVTMKRRIVIVLELLCSKLDTIPRLTREQGKWRWYGDGGCWGCNLGLANLSADLDKRWGTGVWEHASD